jgi:hypothetical protein
MMENNSKPTMPDKPCWACKTKKFWWHEKGKQWLCDTCNPNPNDPESLNRKVVTIDRKYNKGA